MEGSGIPVAVVEDHPLYRAALTRLFTETPGLCLDAVAESVTQFAARSRQCSVVVLDLGLPGVSGAAAVLEVTRMGHRVLVLSAQAETNDVVGAKAAGAWGYLCKNADSTEILAAVAQIAAGIRVPAPAAVPVEPEPAARMELSDREVEVLARLAAGERDQDIAQTLRISVRTVRSYLDRIRDKTGLRRRPELTRYAIEHGMIANPRAISA
ncbi:MAG TPA: response regulator transcription factor [Actinophytocola sp.]|uniref:response regulator transcription factor n=1 Tax=Actinophytocola sp. TaxID=1872138 RepID=UPI002DB60522|nr:response regulator transcription factor [Actinophytocola sp.]HEU5475330.1 response regulator transcription factor [Actinophytocola sp.]